MLNGVTIKITSLGCEQSVAVTDKGEALSWGGGASGGLGHGHKSSILGFIKNNSEFTPWLIKDLEGLKGQGNDIDCMEPTAVDFDETFNALHVSCGFNHTGAIMEYTQTRT